MIPLTVLALFGTLGTTELLLILLIVVLLFGATKLPQLGQALGKTIKGFKREMRDGAGQEGKTEAGPAACPKCGAAVAPEATSCSKCGEPLT